MNAFKKSVAVAMSLLTVANICPVYSASAQNIRTNDSLINKIKRNKDDILDIAKLMVGGGLIISAGVVLGSLIDNSRKSEVSSDLASSSSNGRKAKILSTKQIDVLNDEVEFNGDLSGDAPNAALGWFKNTCCFAALIQFFYSVDEFRNIVLSEETVNDITEGKKDNFRVLQKLFKAMGEKKIIHPYWTYAIAEKLVDHKGRFMSYEECCKNLFDNTGLTSERYGMKAILNLLPLDGSNTLTGNNFVIKAWNCNVKNLFKRRSKVKVEDSDYQLSSFIVYVPGHYVFLKKINNKWYEFDGARCIKYDNCEKLKERFSKISENHVPLALYKKIDEIKS